MSNIKIIAKNKQAFFDYEILERIECGIVLEGSEIKAIRNNKVSLNGSYVKIYGGENQELFWIGGSISGVKDEQRSKKLLINKTEMSSLIGKVQERGLTLVPMELYLKRGYAKLLIAVARGKKLHDKRRDLKKKDIEREQRRGEG